MDRNTLDNYFKGDIWKPTPIEEWKYSGLELINKIEPHEYVIDIGCGFNMFKNKIPNLLGIDPANDEADIKISIEEFEPDAKFDVALCLGSINFGDESVITKQISKIVSILKATSRIYWRCNSGSHDHIGDEDLNFFPWNEEWMRHFAKLFNYNIIVMEYEPNKLRLYSEWKRN
jgi:hypothetical protein